MPTWDDVNARARGLGTHFLSPADLEGLGREPDLAGLASALRHRGLLVGAATEVPTAEEMETALRRWGAEMLRILARWTGPRAAALPLVFDDEDRRSLRAIFRGAAQRAPAAQRLAGLIPTPLLPERALEELASAATIRRAAALLSAWHHPFADAISASAAAAQPDLFALDVALSRAYAQQALAAARLAHSRAVLGFVRDTIDLDNGVTAVVLAGAGRDTVGREMFLPGGAHLSLEAYEAAIATATAAGAGAGVARALAELPYATAFAHATSNTAILEDNLLRNRLHALTGRIRQHPLDGLTPIWFALRLRAQLLDLQRLIWTVALNAPRQWLHDTLTAAAA